MHDDIDLTDLDRFAAGFPHHVFDELRRETPVWFHPPTAHTPGGEGFWVLSRYSECCFPCDLQVSRPSLKIAHGTALCGRVFFNAKVAA